MIPLPSWNQAMAALLPPAFQRVTAACGTHSGSETVRLGPPPPVRLERPLQSLLLPLFKIDTEATNQNSLPVRPSSRRR
jgi:hypothetical protein